MTSERPDRAALRPAEALRVILAGRGATYDPRVVEAFVSLGASGGLAPTSPRSLTASAAA